MSKLNTRIQNKHDIEQNWLKAENFAPLEGEIIIYDADENYSFQRIKIGDGETNVNDLPFVNNRSDWSENDENSISYIQNRTHWVEKGQGNIAFFENIPIEANSSYDAYGSVNDNLSYSGTYYYLIVNNIHEISQKSKYYSSEDLEGGTPEERFESTKINFVWDAGGAVSITNKTNEDIVVSIYNTVPVYHKIDKNFLPNNPVSIYEDETSLIGNDLENNIALGAYSTALGEQNVAGAKGYYIKNLDLTNKKIHLSTTECVPTFETNYSNGEDIDLSAYEIDEYIDITAYSHYHWILCSTIAEVGNGYIVYETDINDPSSKLTTGTVSYYFSVPSKPLAGVINFSNRAFAEGSNNIAAGQFSHTEGYGVISTGRYSHAEGYNTISGYAGHAEGQETQAIGLNAHAEGYSTQAIGTTSHTEGSYTIANGIHAHAEGTSTRANGTHAHAEGNLAQANGESSHAEGENTKANGMQSHAEGRETQANGDRAHAEGFSTKALYVDTHAEGFKTTAGYRNVNENNTVISEGGQAAHAEGMGSIAIEKASHAEGYNTIANQNYQHVQGKYNSIENQPTNGYAHIVGNGTSDAARSNAHTLDWDGNAWFAGDIESGSGKLATENYVSEQIAGIQIPETDLTGYATESYVNNHYIKAGQKSGITIGNKATAEGYSTQANGIYSHAEGYNTIASGERAHAEGFATNALFTDTHAEGFRTIAGKDGDGQGAHAEGMNTSATGKASHAEGYGTKASGECQHVQGKYNVEDPSKVHIVGWGSSASAPANIHTLDTSGNAWFAGNVSVGNSYETEGWNDNGDSHTVKAYSRLPRIFSGTVNPNEFYNDNGQINFGQDGDIYIMLSE